MQKNYNENLVAGAAIRDDKGRRISKLFEASHPKMTVGYAKNLIMPNTPTEQEFNFRQSGGGVIEDGVAVIDKVKGNSVVWNQKLHNDVVQSKTIQGVTFTHYADGSIVANGTAIGNECYIDLSSVAITKNSFVIGHKYLLKGCPNGGSSATYYYGSWNVFQTNNLIDYGNGAIDICTRNTGSFNVVCLVNNGVTVNNIVFRPQIIDLTQMFGAGNEPSTYEEFLQRKPKVADEYAYNEGTIVNNKVERVVTTGRNLFDSSTAIDGKTINDTDGAEVENSLGWCSTFIPIIGGETYFCKGVRIDVQAYGVHYYDKDKQHINGVGILQNGSTFDAPINAKHIRIHGLYDSSPANAAILNLSDASFNGQYAPYEKHELDLSWIKEIKDTEGVKLFEDGMRSAGTAFDEVGKNRAVKRVGVVDLGTLTWELSTSNSNVFYTKNNIGRKINTGKEWFSGNGVLSKYILVLRDTPGWHANIDTLYSTDKSYCLYNSNDNTQYIHVHDSAYSDVVTFKAAMSGVMLIYELAEPIEVEYDEKSLTYPVVAGGTEEAIASEPSSAFRADIGYGIDAVKTILDLKARVEALEGK